MNNISSNQDNTFQSLDNQKPLSPVKSPLPTSPTSAFTQYKKSNSPPSWEKLPLLIQKLVNAIQGWETLISSHQIKDSKKIKVCDLKTLGREVDISCSNIKEIQQILNTTKNLHHTSLPTLNSNSLQHEVIYPLDELMKAIKNHLAENQRIDNHYLNETSQSNIKALIHQANTCIPTLQNYFPSLSISHSSQNPLSSIPGKKRKTMPALFIQQNLSETKNLLREIEKGYITFCHLSSIDTLQALNQMMDDQETADIILQVEERKFYAHRSILFHRVPEFKNIMSRKSSGINKIPTKTIREISKETFEEVLSFIYTGKVSLSLSTLIPLYQAADRLSLESLKCLCKGYFAKQLSIRNGLFLLQQAHDAAVDIFYQETFLFTLSHARAMFNEKSDAFLKLSSTLFLKLLESTRLNLHEEEVIQAAITWLNAQEPNPDLISQVKRRIRLTNIKLEKIWSHLYFLQVQGKPFFVPEELALASGRIIQEKIENSRKLRNEWIASKCEQPFEVKECGDGEKIIYWKVPLQLNAQKLDSPEFHFGSAIWNLSFAFQTQSFFQLDLHLKSLDPKLLGCQTAVEAFLIHQDARQTLPISSLNAPLRYGMSFSKELDIYRTRRVVVQTKGLVNSGFSHDNHLLLQIRVKMLGIHQKNSKQPPFHPDSIISTTPQIHTKRQKLEEEALPSVHSCVLEMIQSLHQMNGNTHSTDTILRVEENFFYVHRAILMHCSKAFKELLLNQIQLGNNQQIIPIDNISKKAMMPLLSFLYGQRVSLSLDTIIPVYQAAHHYELKGLEEICKLYLYRQLSSQNAISLLIQAYQECREIPVYQLIFNFVLTNAPRIFKQGHQDFLQLPFSLFVKLLESNKLNLEEKEVMQAAITWLEAQDPNRDLLSSVKNCIRFTCMPIGFIWNQVKQAKVHGSELCSQEELIEISVKIGRGEIQNFRSILNPCLLTSCEQPFAVQMSDNEGTVLWKAPFPPHLGKKESPSFQFKQGNYQFTFIHKEGSVYRLSLKPTEFSLASAELKVEGYLIHKDLSKTRLPSFKRIQASPSLTLEWSCLLEINPLSGFINNQHVALQIRIKQ